MNFDGWVSRCWTLNAGCRMGHRHYGQMGRGEATGCYLIQAWQSTDNHRCMASFFDFDSRTLFDLFPLLRFLLDRMQVFYRGCRDTKVRGRGPPLRSSARRSIRESDFSHSSRFSFFPGSGGFGNVPTGSLVNTDTLSQQDSFSSPRRRRWRRQRRRTRSAWRNS